MSPKGLVVVVEEEQGGDGVDGGGVGVVTLVRNVIVVEVSPADDKTEADCVEDQLTEAWVE